MIQKIFRTLRILGCSSLSFPSRLGLIYLAIKRRLSSFDRYRLGLTKGSVFFSGKDVLYDYTTFWDIFVIECYSTEYKGAVVLDIGAHKGYFGAYALEKGASSVYSFEPEEGNFKFLSMAVKSQKGYGKAWVPVHCAVGSKEGTAELHVTDRSWSHSIVPRSDRPTLSTQKVTVRSLSFILENAKKSIDNAKLIVKIDVEGAVCDIILGTPSDRLSNIDELFFEYESFSPCSIQSLVSHLEKAGLKQGESPRGDVYRLSKNVGP